MGARGTYLAQSAHIVNILPPQNISGGVNAQTFNLKGAGHVSIVIQMGAQAAAEIAILLKACSNAAGANPAAIPFKLHKQEVTGTANDVLGSYVTVPATGYAPPGVANTFYVIELDASELPQGLPYLQLQITNGANADYVSAVAILSGLRYGGDQNPTATT